MVMDLENNSGGKMKIYVDKLPKCCGDCELIQTEILDFMDEHRIIDRSFCPFTRESVCENKRSKSCPLIELKPKELEWVWLDVFDLYSALNGKYTISTSRIYENEPIYYSYYFLGIHIDNVDSLNDAKEMCQKHCNDLFHEMIGE